MEFLPLKLPRKSFSSVVREGKISSLNSPLGVLYSVSLVFAFSFRTVCFPYEGLFFKSGALHTEYWRVYFELHGEDLAILKDGKSLGLKTQTIVQSSGVLNLLPRDLDNGWNELGRIVDDGNLESWALSQRSGKTAVEFGSSKEQ
jgi:hypothetical protein